MFKNSPQSEANDSGPPEAILPTWRGRVRAAAETESLRPDLSRAVRGTAGIMVPILLQRSGYFHLEVIYAALVAQIVASIDVKGPYSLRLSLLGAISLVLAGSAALGGLMANHLVGLLGATAFVALGSGLWRHLSSEYGPSLAVASTLVFAIAAAGRGGPSVAFGHETSALWGGVLGVTLQVILWPIRAEHPLRKTVAATWEKLGSLFNAMALSESTPTERHLRVSEAEGELHTAMGETSNALNAAPKRPLTARLEALHSAAGSLSTRVSALSAALEVAQDRPDFKAVGPATLPVLIALGNTARTVALAVVSQQPSHLATFDVRARRLGNLIQALRSHIDARWSEGPERFQLDGLLQQIAQSIPGIESALRVTFERTNNQLAFSMELFDLNTWRLKALAAALNPSLHIDPSILRYTLRIGALTMIGVAAFKLLGLPHGYWLPFAMVVVLQPDYGSTRKRALERTLGTLAGGLLASVFLWLHLPVYAVLAATALTSFIYLYLIKSNYGLAVVFVTLFVVFLTESSSRVTLTFTLERLACNAAGGLLALLAAVIFWPVWERDRLPPILSAALRANRDYLRIVIKRIQLGVSKMAPALSEKMVAEKANTEVFSSLRRMSGDPKNRRDQMEVVAAIANGNQRLTRLLGIITLHLPGSQPMPDPAVEEFSERASQALDALASQIQSGIADPGTLTKLRQALDAPLSPLDRGFASPSEAERREWIVAQLGRAGTELSAMLLA